jgi:hypothetical protein
MLKERFSLLGLASAIDLTVGLGSEYTHLGNQRQEQSRDHTPKAGHHRERRAFDSTCT